MTNVAAAVSTPTLALIGARPPLDHDPQYMHNVCAARLSDITVDQVMTLLLNVTHTTAPQP